MRQVISHQLGQIAQRGDGGRSIFIKLLRADRFQRVRDRVTGLFEEKEAELQPGISGDANRKLPPAWKQCLMLA